MTVLVAITEKQAVKGRADLTTWLKHRLSLLDADAEEAEAAVAKARLRKWEVKGFQRIANQVEESRVWYAKLLAAIEAGYTMLPDLPMTVFAVRRTGPVPPKHVSKTNDREWRSNELLQGMPAAVGAGQYVGRDAERRVTTREHPDAEKPGKTVVTRNYWNDSYRPVGLPVALVKPELIDATDRALEELIFDEIGLCEPVRSNPDPMVLGRIFRGKDRRRSVCFTIAWFVDLKDL